MVIFLGTSGVCAGPFLSTPRQATLDGTYQCWLLHEVGAIDDDHFLSPYHSLGLTINDRKGHHA